MDLALEEEGIRYCTDGELNMGVGGICTYEPQPEERLSEAEEPGINRRVEPGGDVVDKFIDELYVIEEGDNMEFGPV